MLNLLRWIVGIGVAFIGLLLVWLGLALAPQSGGGAWVMAIVGTAVFVFALTRLINRRPRRFDSDL
jgi:uncharacterized membrane protein